MTRNQNQEIIHLVRDLRILAVRAGNEYEQELDEIINSNCCDKRQIERTLDGMLSFCFDKKMLELFRKLCKYYYFIDRNAAAEYVLIYRECGIHQKIKSQIIYEKELSHPYCVHRSVECIKHDWQ